MQSISQEQTKLWCGIATISVFLHHIAIMNVPDELLHKIFKFLFFQGDFGVNIFFFLSAYGLCYSFEGRSRTSFYAQRIKRLYPMCILFMLGYIALNGNTLEFWIPKVLSHITGISLFRDEVFPEWFIPAITLLYITLPLLLKIVRYIYKINVYLILVILIIPLVFSYTNVPQIGIELFIPRIPTIILGITLYLADKDGNTNKALHLYILYALLSLTLSQRIAFCFVPLIILVSSQKQITFPCTSFIRSIGKHSLELYLTQCLFIYSLDFSSDNYYIMLSKLIGITVLFSAFLYFVHKGFWIMYNNAKEKLYTHDN